MVFRGFWGSFKIHTLAKHGGAFLQSQHLGGRQEDGKFEASLGYILRLTLKRNKRDTMEM
jgi:hypothetical protein